jgi:PAS domain-containing protein
MRARAAPRRDEKGKIIRWYGTLEDIDDHKNAEEALRRSEARLQAIFNSVPIGIVIADAPDGRVVMSNPRADDILRTVVAPPAVIDDYCQHPPQDPRSNAQDQVRENPLASAIMDGKTIGPRECLRTYDDGSSGWVCFTASPVLDHNGKVSGGVVTIQDIDEEKREKQRLSELADALRNKLATHR